MVAKKPADRRQNSVTKDFGEVVALRQVPALAQVSSKDWSAEVRAGWDEFWLEPIAAVVKPSDLPALRRLFDLREKLVRCEAAIDAEPTTTGSMGQQVLSPWVAEQHRLFKAIGRLEDQFGLSPLARLKLGVTFAEGNSLADRNKKLVEEFRAQQQG